MLATVVFDLTIAILLGVGLSVAIFVYRSTNFRLDVSPIDTAKLNDRGISDAEIYHKAVVCYLTGPVFFGTIDKVREKLSDAHGHDTILLSMRGVPHIDTSGTEYLYEFVNEAKEKGTNVCLCGLHDSVLQKLTQGGIIDVIGKENVYWSVDVALGALPKNLSAQSESTAR